MTTTQQVQRDGAGTALGALSLLVFAASGVVLTVSWAVEWPDAVFLLGLTASALAAVAFGAFTFADSRRQGDNFLTAVRSAIRRLGHFILWFF